MQEKLFKISETAKIVDHQFSEKLCSGLLKVLCYLLKVEGEVALQKKYICNPTSNIKTCWRISEMAKAIRDNTYRF